MSKILDVLASESYAKATDEQKAQLTTAVNNLEAILKDSGFNVLINKFDGKEQEFVPGSRIKEVTAQKHALTGEVENLNKSLKKMKKAAENADDAETAGKIEALIKANNLLKTNNTEQHTMYQIKLAAMKLNPHNLDDFVNLVNRDVIQNIDGSMLGLDAEMARLKKDKGYMLNSAKDDTHENDETFDKEQNQQEKASATMNDLIRSAAGIRIN